MNEWKRILGYRSIQLFLVFAFVLNGVLFVLEQENTQQNLTGQYSMTIRQIYSEYNELVENYRDKSISYTKNKVEEKLANVQSTSLETELYEKIYEQLTFMDEYSEYLEFVQEQAKNLEKISLFSDEKSFANKNIKKTASDYKKILNVKLVLGSDEAVKNMISYTASDYILFTLVIFLCFQLLSERKKGLWDIVHSTKNGRGVLARKRMGILFASTVLFSAAIHGTIIFLSFYYYGGMEELKRPVQSIELLSSCPIKCTILQFLIQYYLLKTVGLFLIALITWCMMSSVHNLSLGIMFFSVGIAIEYSLFRFLPVQSFINVFKYVNIFSYIECKDIYINYLNLNLFGKAINVRVLIMVLLPIFLCIFGCIAVHVNAVKRPKESSFFLSVIWKKIQWVSNFILNKLNSFGLELYKILCIQKGIIVLAVFVIIEMNTISNIKIYYSPAEQIFMSYCEKINGPYDDEARQIIDEIQIEVADEEKEISKIMDDYGEGKINSAEYESQMVEHQQIDNKRKALEMLQEKIEQADELKQKYNITIWIMDDIGYSRLLGSESYKRQLVNAMTGILFVVLLTSQIAVFETIHQTKQLLRSTEKGRKLLFQKKCFAALLMTLIVWAGTYGCELFNIYKLYSLTFLGAPIQSVTGLSDFPIYNISIAGFLVILYIMKLFLLCCVTGCVLLISTISKRIEHSLTISMVIMLFPSLFYYAGIARFKFIAAVIPIAGMELFQSNHGVLKSIIAYLVSAIVGGLCIYFARKKWIANIN